MNSSWTYSADVNPYLRPSQPSKDQQLFVKQLDWTLGHKLPAYPLGSPFEQAQHYKSVAYAAITTTQRALMGTQIGLERPRVAKAGLPDTGAKKTDSKYIPYDSHPLSNVLKRPNPVMPWSQFQAYWILQRSLHGRTIIWKVRNRAGGVIRMYIIPTPLCTPAFGVGSEEYPVGAWRVQTYYPNTGLGGVLPGPLAGSAGAVIDGRDIIVDDSLHPLYPWTPYSPLVGMDTEFDVVEKMSRAVWTQLVRGVINPSGYIDMPGANEPAINSMQSKILEKWAGANNAGVPLVIGGGDPERPAVKWNPVTPTSQQMGFGDMWDKYLDFTLAGSFGLDRSSLGMSTGSYAERYAAKQDVRERTYEPMLAGFANVLTDGVLPDWGLTDHGCRVNIVLPQLQDPTLVDARNKAAAESSTMSVNEIRATTGLDPVDGGELPPKLYEQYIAKKSGLAPTAMDQHAAEQENAKQDREAIKQAPQGKPSSPDNPQAEGSLPPRMQKAMSAYQGNAGGTLVGAGKKRRVLRGRRAKVALGCMIKAITEG